jgi:putative Mg2+ transporter-C (MgtC) family protein
MEIVDTNWLQQLEVVVKVVIAGFMGGIVGLERELANRPAGLRTHAILAAAAALLVGTADFLVTHFVGETPPAVLRADPIRVVEAIVTGVSFLGAGTIFRKQGGTVEGLTTAASLLLVAAIGIVVALGQLLLAALVTVVTLVLLRTVARVVAKTTSART